jgi:succinate-semialdehyde dehydrogenase/glutarate-semialdehyde dehydrogenase
MAEHHRMFVDGEWIEAAGGGTFAVSDPATGEVVGHVADGGPAEAARAVQAAHRAFRDWAAMPARERAPILHRIQSLMETHREDLARLVTCENGKPLDEARREVAFALGYFGWFAEEARRAYGDLVPSPARDKRLWVLRQPVGVVAAVTPWNFPATMVTRKIAPALRP